MNKFFCSLVLGLALIVSCTVSARAVPTDVRNSPLFDPMLAEDFLNSAPQPSGQPSLRVKYYDEIEGLLAGYESSNGKRILFRAKHHPGGALIAAAFHYDDVTQSVKPLMAPGVVNSADYGRTTIAMLIAGVSVQPVLRLKVAGKLTSTDRQFRQLHHFMQDKTGQAFNDGVMALYVLLEPFDTSPALAMLKMPFGAVRMSAEMATGHYAGFGQAEHLLGLTRANLLRDNCKKGQCLYRNSQFMLHDSGLFDMLSKHVGTAQVKAKTAQHCVSSELSRLDQPFDPDRWRNEPDCHGCCGPSCWGCLGFATSECSSHDDCVDRHGHLSCIFSSPGGLFNSLIDAIGSVLEYLGDLIFGTIGNGFDGCDSYVVCDPWRDFDGGFWSIP